MLDSLEIKDITGLKEPLIKLIEVVSKGIGNLSEPYLIKKRADAKSYELKKINEALRESNANGNIVFDGDKVSFETSLIDGEIKERALNRMFYQQVKKQENIEKIIGVAKQDLEETDTVSSDKVNEDWITRFFDISENVSDEDMQILWGKILAGEITKPSTYSLRTLEALRNMSRTEAQVFTKVAQFAIIDDDRAFLLDDISYLKEKHGVNVEELLLMNSIGMLHNPDGVLVSLNEVTDNDKIEVLFNCNTEITMKRKRGAPKLEFGIILFTDTGKELLHLVNVEYNENYKEKIISFFSQPNVEVSIQIHV